MWRIVALTLILVAGCSSSRSGPPSAPPSTSSTPSSATPPTQAVTSAPTSADPSAAVQDYVDKVSALCDDLLPKILAVTHNGNPAAFTVAQYKAHLAAHTALEKGFDAKFHAVPVPPGAQTAQKAMQNYIDYADKLDAMRLAAADRGQAAFVREVRSEVTAYDNSAVKKARDAAGFAQSCDAR